MKQILIIIACSISLSLFGQDTIKKSNKQIAFEQIQKLKKGILLVRLYNKQPVIDALEQKGMKKRAAYIKKKQEEVNKEIVAAFDEFNFASVYFFYSNQSDLLRNKEFDKVTLYQQGVAVKNVNLTSDFFMADFGMLDKTYHKSTDDGKRKPKDEVRKYKGGSSTTNIKCMMIKGNNLELLRSPFPFYVRFHPTPIQNLSYKQIVDRMENKLNKFAKKNI